MNNLIKTPKLPALYEDACRAIDVCEKIDECKEWSDQAAAMAAYAKQSRDRFMLDRAIRIQLRAKARIGEMILAIPCAPKGWKKGISRDVGNVSSRRSIGRQYGFSKTNIQTMEAMARVPKKKREALIEMDPPPSAVGLGSHGRIPGIYTPAFKAGEAYKDVMNGSGTYGMGGFARWTEKKDPVELARQMSPDEADRLRLSIQKIVDWIDKFDQHLPKAKP